jgi:hypothetical protein
LRLERGDGRGPLRFRHPHPAREPGPIDTEIWDLPDNDAPLYSGPKISAREMAQGIATAMENESFERYVPDMRAIVEAKTANPDPFIEGMAAMLRSLGR